MQLQIIFTGFPVLSGINRGYNLGHDIVYSGTVGAIFEGARLGMKGIALSTDIYGFDKAFEMLDSTYKFILDNKITECYNPYVI